MSRTARVTFKYVAEQDDELSLEVGAIIRNIKDVDTGWCQGELNGKTGLFPDTFVEEVDITPDVDPASDSVAGKEAKVTFDYEAHDQDELTLKLGDIVHVLGEEEQGWWRGQLGGKRGVFPSNFVEIITDNNVAKPKDTPLDPARKLSVAGKEAKVTFDYEAHDQDELTLKLGDIVHVLGEEEQGWWRGQLGGKRGVFPSNFVEIITDNNVAKPKDTPLDPARKLSGETSPLEKKTTRNEVVGGLHVNDDEESGIKRTSNFGAAAKKLPGGGMGFGNLINPKILAEKKLKKVHQDEKRENKGKTEEAFVSTTEPSKPSLVKTKTPVSSKERSAPPVALASPDESDIDATPEHTVSPVRPDKRPAHFATKEQPPSKNAVPSQPIKVVRPTPGKKPVAPQKPSLPSKKPLPLKSKKPDVAAEKPEKKVVDSGEIAGAKKGGDEAELKDEVHIKPTPDIKSENVDEVSRTDTNFERQRDLLQHKGGMVACLVEQLQKKELQQEIGRTQLQEKEEQTREKENDKANLQRQLEVLQQQLREKEQCLDNYQAQLEETNLRETNLIQQLQEKELQRENCQRQLQEMEEQIREKEDNKANSGRQLREMAQSFEERMGEKEEEKTNLETQLRMKNQHKGGMVACLVEQLQKKELQQEIGRTQLQEKEEQTREKENDKANLQRQLEVLQQQLREKEQCLDNYQAQLEERNLRETNLIQQLQEKELQRENCQRQLQEMEEQIREKEDNKANSGRQLREMAQSFEERMGEKEEEKTNLETQLRMKNQHKGGMVACLVEQLQEKELQQEIGRTQLQEKEEQTREKENDKANLQRQLEVLQQQLREKEQCLDNYQAQLEETNLRETNLIQQLQEKELQRENCQRQLQEMEEQIREKEDNKANSGRQLREMAQSFEERMGEKEEEKTNLETQLRMKNQQLSELETSLSAAQQMIIELRQESCDWVISRDEIQVKDKSLGKGGWGSVNEATYCGCKVAVKQIHELILSPHNRRLFEREMYIASRCRHPCLLQFIGATNDEGSPLFVTELMELSLRALLEQRQLTETQISVISLDISRALNYLHHMKPPIVHRDVSSANVLLWRRGEQWRGKLSDYGTAKFVQQNMTVAPGALIYSAPEAVSSNQTSKVDVYSFGVLLCEMYIREMPDPERREEQVLLVRNRFFRNLVRQCLQADPATRPDMAQIIQQLEQFYGTDDRLN
ncbi:uncharacterized protein [Montipora foliosa]|uniref:uncharacterized protein isoform X2 n=1 Tax=Montipora foliosa TaxID=591990 RepID=UPI0035F16F14